MAKPFVMDENTESAFRQLLGIQMDQPIPSQVRLLWAIALRQYHNWASGGPLPEPDIRNIAMMHTAGVMTRFAGASDEDKKPAEDKKVA